MTPEQESALALDHHVVVHANAGAGKTTVLVERFISIVLSGKVDSIEQIVATTFTIKAAAEMRSRIRKRLLELTSQSLDKQTPTLDKQTPTLDKQTPTLDKQTPSLDKQTHVRLLEFANN